MCEAHCVPLGPWKSIQQKNQIHRALACVYITSDQANNAGNLHLQPFFQGLKSLNHLSGCTGKSLCRCIWSNYMQLALATVVCVMQLVRQRATRHFCGPPAPLGGGEMLTYCSETVWL